MNREAVLKFLKSDKFVVPVIATAVAGVILAVRNHNAESFSEDEPAEIEVGK